MRKRYLQGFRKLNGLNWIAETRHFDFTVDVLSLCVFTYSFGITATMLVWLPEKLENGVDLWSSAPYTIPACHGQTDGQTDRRTKLLYQYRASVCWRAIKTGGWSEISLIRMPDRYLSSKQFVKMLSINVAPVFVNLVGLVITRSVVTYRRFRKVSVSMCIMINGKW